MDKTIGFSNIDSLCEKYYATSLDEYYCSDSVNRFDLDGKRRWAINPTYNGYEKRHENNFGSVRSNGIITRIVKIEDRDKDGSENRIQITSSDGNVSTYYMHIDAFSDGIQTRTIVTEGLQIGTKGGSGNGKSDIYPSHLHYAIKINGMMIDPASSLAKFNRSSTTNITFKWWNIGRSYCCCVTMVFIPEINHHNYQINLQYHK